MRPDALIPLIGAMVNLGLAIFVLAQNPRSPVGRVFFLLGVCFAVWNFGTYRLFRVPTVEQAAFWARFVQFGVIWIPMLLVHLSSQIAKIEVSPAVWYAGYGLDAVLFCCNFTPLLVSGARPFGYAFYAIKGPLFPLIFITFGLMWYSVLVLWKHRRAQPMLVRRRLSPLIFAQTAIAVFGSNDALPIMGVDHYPFTNSRIYPFGSMAAISYGLIVGYSVLQHQLLNVHVVLSRYSAHLVRLLFLFIIGSSLLVVMAAFTHEFTTLSFLSALGVLMASAWVTATLFPRLLGGASEDFERRLLGDSFEYQDQVRSFIDSMTWYNEIAPLQNDLHSLLVRTFRLETYQIVMREEVTTSFTLAQSWPEEPSRVLPELRPESPAFRFFQEGRGEYLSLQGEHLHLTAATVERQARQQLRHFHSEYCFPLAWQDEPFGLIMVGRKTSGDPFTATDIRLLIALAKNMSLVVSQLRLKVQIQHAQELDLLGRMSRGMAHDLNNLLTPISTLLQLSVESGELDDELLPVASRNLGMIRAYINEALFFSENLRPDIQAARFDKVVRQAIETAVNSRDKEVTVMPIVPEEVNAELDAVLVQRLVANLIANAIDASPTGSEVVVSLERLARVDRTREWLRLRVIDKGEGIARENLDRIFTPYFTTKNRGDNGRGFGLGLAICRKIATLHGGSLSIDSQLKKGTAVQLDLPSRQIQAEPHPMPIPTAA